MNGKKNIEHNIKNSNDSIYSTTCHISNKGKHLSNNLDNTSNDNRLRDDIIFTNKVSSEKILEMIFLINSTNQKVQYFFNSD